MAYEKQQWQDEILNEPNVHFDVIDENGNVIYHRVRITRQSTAAQEGTKVTAELMNHIEDGINDVHVNLVNNAGAHNSIYRGASLGPSVSAAQFAAIGANTFNDLWLGDYWTIGGVVWRIAGFNYYWNVGDTNCATPHITIVPDMILYNAQMNTTNIVTGAYVGSAMYTANLAQAKTAINAAFGAAHILNHRVLLANAVSENAVTGWAWYDSTVELLTEYQVYGARAGALRRTRSRRRIAGRTATRLRAASRSDS